MNSLLPLAAYGLFGVALFVYGSITGNRSARVFGIGAALSALLIGGFLAWALTQVGRFS